MRNSDTDKYAEEVRILFKESGLELMDFIESIKSADGVFDTNYKLGTEVGEYPTYASFSRVVDNHVLYCYFVSLSDEKSGNWYCKY